MSRFRAAESTMSSRKRQRIVQTVDRAGSTIGDLYDWPSKLAAKLHRIPRLRYNWNAHLAKGNCMVIYSDHSGSGNGEEGLLDAITALKEYLGGADAQGGRAADLLDPIAHSVCDPDPHAIQALSATSHAKHLFGSVEDFVSKDMMSDIGPFVPSAQASADQRSAFLKDACSQHSFLLGYNLVVELLGFFCMFCCIHHQHSELGNRSRAQPPELLSRWTQSLLSLV